MNEYIKSYQGYGRFLRYCTILQNTSISEKEKYIQQALDYCEEIHSLGGFTRIREVLSSEIEMKEPQWRNELSSKAFLDQKSFDEKLSKLYTDDDRAKILFEECDRHEYYGEFQKGIKCCMEALEAIKTKELIAEGCYRLIRLNIFIDNFHQANTYLELLKKNTTFSGKKYNDFITFVEFLLALRSPETFAKAFELLEQVIIFDEKETWKFNEFLSFEDVAIYGMLVGLLTQDHKTNEIKLINNPKFRNHAETVPELVELMKNYKENQFALISSNVKQLEKYFTCNVYFGQSLTNCVSTIKNKCYKEYIFAYSVVDMNLMSSMFGESLQTIQNALEEFIYSDVIKAKIDATTHTLHFVEGDERYQAYSMTMKTVQKAINLSQEIVLKSDAMFDY